MKQLFPKAIDNHYTFHKSLVYIFAFITCVTIGRSLIHMFAPDGGANSIASIILFEGTPDPNKVIYMIFSLWGLSQLLMGLWYLVVLIRYKTLIPLMYGFITLEYIMRLVIGQIKPLTSDYFAHVAPGAILNYVMIPLGLLLMFLSLKNQKETI